ncbi:MAG: hypothetical protein AAGC67_11085, partial [Myxococcota bacterium]
MGLDEALGLLEESGGLRDDGDGVGDDDVVEAVVVEGDVHGVALDELDVGEVVELDLFVGLA